MGDPISYLEQRVKDIKLQLQQATETLTQTQARVAILTADLDGFERVLAAERRLSGGGAAIEAREAALSLAVESAVETNKAEFARQLIRKRGDIGTKPMDLFRGFQESGIPITRWSPNCALTPTGRFSGLWQAVLVGVLIAGIGYRLEVSRLNIKSTTKKSVPSDRRLSVVGVLYEPEHVETAAVAARAAERRDLSSPNHSIVFMKGCGNRLARSQGFRNRLSGLAFVNRLHWKNGNNGSGGPDFTDMGRSATNINDAKVSINRQSFPESAPVPMNINVEHIQLWSMRQKQGLSSQFGGIFGNSVGFPCECKHVLTGPNKPLVCRNRSLHLFNRFSDKPTMVNQGSCLKSECNQLEKANYHQQAGKSGEFPIYLYFLLVGGEGLIFWGAGAILYSRHLAFRGLGLFAVALGCVFLLWALATFTFGGWLDFCRSLSLC